MKRSALVSFMKSLVKKRGGQAAPEAQESCLSCQVALVRETSCARPVLRCPSCRGLWLTATALGSALCENTESPELDGLVGNDGDSEIGHTFAPSRLARCCPTCAAPMENHKFEDSGVWIDTCAAGHGIWLDRGELKLLSERKKHRPGAAPESAEDSLEDAVSDVLLSFL